MAELKVVQKAVQKDKKMVGKKVDPLAVKKVVYLVVKIVDSRVVYLVGRLADVKIVKKVVKMVESLVEKKVDSLVGKKVGN